MTRWLFTALLVALAVALLVSLMVSLMMGPSSWSGPDEVITVVAARLGLLDAVNIDSESLILVGDIRLPRACLAILVGASLAVSGAIMQAVFNNPLAEPYIVGVSAGAGFGAVLVAALGLQAGSLALNVRSVGAFAGALLTVLLVYQVASRRGVVSVAALLLAGVAISGLLSSLSLLLLLQLESQRFHTVLGWMLGTLAYRDWSYVTALLPYTLLGLTAAVLWARTLNVMTTGEETARALGVHVAWTRLLLLGVASLLAAAAVAACGIIGFVGLIVPHCLRPVVGANHQRLLPACALGGALLTVWADAVARTAVPGQEIPIGSVTAVIGCLFFLHLMRNEADRVA